MDCPSKQKLQQEPEIKLSPPTIKPLHTHPPSSGQNGSQVTFSGYCRSRAFATADISSHALNTLRICVHLRCFSTSSTHRSRDGGYNPRRKSTSTVTDILAFLLEVPSCGDTPLLLSLRFAELPCVFTTSLFIVFLGTSSTSSFSQESSRGNFLIFMFSSASVTIFTDSSANCTM